MNDPADHPGLDPIALTLALWLGVVTCAMGVVRLANDAAMQSAMAQQDSNRAATAVTGLDPAAPFSPQLMALGG